MNTLAEARRQPTLRFVLSHPAHFFAFGFGAGLVRVAPGTWGTVLAFPIYYGLASVLSMPLLLAAVAGGFLLGVWLCGVTGRHLGVHDHGGMVWDEIVAFTLVLCFTPPQPAWQLIAFALFRLFDILKPPPIRQFDRGIQNGFGVMLDDLLAALYTLFSLMLVKQGWDWLVTSG